MSTPDPPLQPPEADPPEEADPPAPHARRRPRVPAPTQAELDALPAQAKMELRLQQRTERHQWLNSVGILFGVAFTAASLVATALALRTAQQDLRTSQDTLRVARESQITDRYAKTLEALADDQPTIRLGAIHALDRLLTDSVRDRAAILAVLAGYLRAHDPDPGVPDAKLPTEPAADLVAALRVLLKHLPAPPKRTSSYFDTGDLPAARADLNSLRVPRIELRTRDLRNLNLTASNWSGALLAHSDFSECVLRKANLRNADLGNARFDFAHLNDADLRSANLSVAHLYEAELVRADLRGAQLVGADLREARLTLADLRNADLRSADLRGALLDRADLRGADLTQARLPDPAGLRARVKHDQHTQW